MKTKAHQRYRLEDGTVVPGVTTIIGNNLGWNKNALVGWARKEALKGNDPDKVRDEAAEIGTLAHYLSIDCWLNGVEPETADYTKNQIEKATPCLEQFKAWWTGQEFELYKSEWQLVSTHGFGGTVDIVARKGKEYHLIDVKTSSGVYPEMKIQLAAYRELLEEAFFFDTDYKELIGFHIIQLPKTGGSFTHYQIDKETINAGWNIFTNLLEINRLKGELN